MATIEVKVPDIGDYSDVPVIEILVAVGDTVKKDQGLLTLESDKATLEVPSSAAGVVKELKVKLGDTLSEGAVVVLLEAEGEGAAPAAPELRLAATDDAYVSSGRQDAGFGAEEKLAIGPVRVSAATCALNIPATITQMPGMIRAKKPSFFR